MGTINRFAFTEAIRQMGDAEVWINELFSVAGGWRSLGAKEGAITEAQSWTQNALTAPEHTGGIPHKLQYVLASMAVTIPIIAGHPDLWDIISPTGAPYGVGSSPSDAKELSMFLVPRIEVPEGVGLSYTTPAGMSDPADNWTARQYPPNSSGNATVASITGKTAGVRQRITITFTSATAFTVVGSASGSLGTGTLGTPFTSTAIDFTATAGAQPQAAGDVKYIMVEAFAGEGWSPAAPVNALFFPRCSISHGDVGRPYEQLGKSVVPVTIQPMFYASGPAGKQVYVRGDPVYHGYTTFKI
ncbi:MAG TPA: hypothetical protein VLD58_12355 [Gemmatimonadales bacterium]|nr:hypothetical protein [Gemmatimonadales bacterium]